MPAGAYLRGRFALVSELEHRPDKNYDEVTPSNWVMPNGTIAATVDLALSTVIGRLVYQAVMAS